MPHHDPMHYSMEQLVKALARETIFEFVDTEDVEFEEDFEKPNTDKWESMAKSIIKEIDGTYSGEFLQPLGYYADICVRELESIVRAYSHNPWAKLLLDAISDLISEEHNHNTYTDIVVRAMGSDDATVWKRNNNAK